MSYLATYRTGTINLINSGNKTHADYSTSARNLSLAMPQSIWLAVDNDGFTNAYQNGHIIPEPAEFQWDTATQANAHGIDVANLDK